MSDTAAILTEIMYAQFTLLLEKQINSKISAATCFVIASALTLFASEIRFYYNVAFSLDLRAGSPGHLCSCCLVSEKTDYVEWYVKLY